MFAQVRSIKVCLTVIACNVHNIADDDGDLKCTCAGAGACVNCLDDWVKFNTACYDPTGNAAADASARCVEINAGLPGLNVAVTADTAAEGLTCVVCTAEITPGCATCGTYDNSGSTDITCATCTAGYFLSASDPKECTGKKH